MPTEIAFIYILFVWGSPREMVGRELDNNCLQGTSHFLQKKDRRENAESDREQNGTYT